MNAANHVAPAPGAEFTPLQQLLRKRRDELGLSYSEIEASSGINRATVHAILTTPGRQPKPENLEALARGLRLPLATVTREAQLSAGYVVEVSSETDSELEVFVHMLREMTPERRRIVLDIANTLHDRQRTETDR